MSVNKYLDELINDHEICLTRIREEFEVLVQEPAFIEAEDLKSSLYHHNLKINIFEKF